MAGDRRKKDLGPPDGVERRSGEDRRKGPRDRRQRRRMEIQISTVIAVATTILAIFGYIYTQGQNDKDIDNKIDRNCRVLASIQADEQFIIILHSSNRNQAKAFQEIFKEAAKESCGGTS